MQCKEKIMWSSLDDGEGRSVGGGIGLSVWGYGGTGPSVSGTGGSGPGLSVTGGVTPFSSSTNEGTVTEMSQ